jgi:hypothetical protein
MRALGFLMGAVTSVFFFAAGAACEEAPVKASVCNLQDDPAAWNHKLVEVTGFVSHDFEDFTIFDPSCSARRYSVWLEYGGTAKSGTTYCCGVSDNRNRPEELVVEGIAIPLTRDEKFLEFDKSIQPPFRSGKYGVVLRATLVGRFFPERRFTTPGQTYGADMAIWAAAACWQFNK